MELTPSTPSHCILQVLLVSPPPPSHHSHHSEPSQTSQQTNNTNSKPFSPWKPGDAYSVEQDLSDWRLLLGSIEEGDQTRWGRGLCWYILSPTTSNMCNIPLQCKLIQLKENDTPSLLSAPPLSQSNQTPQINNRINVKPDDVDCCCFYWTFNICKFYYNVKYLPIKIWIILVSLAPSRSKITWI